MAAFGLAPRPSTSIPSTAELPSSSKRPLPRGPCNYGDPVVGSCGCSQFWDKQSQELHEGSTEHCPISQHSTWCVCGHHACYHLPEHRVPREKLLSPPSAGKHRFAPRCDGHCQSVGGSQYTGPRGLRTVEEEGTTSAGTREHRIGRPRSSPSGFRQQPAQQRILQSVNRAALQPRDSTSEPSASGLPRIPSVCLLGSNDLRPVGNTVEQQTGQDNHDTSRYSPSGLGLFLQTGNLGNTNGRRQSHSTAPDEVAGGIGRSYNGSQIPSTETYSLSDDNAHLGSPGRALMDHALGLGRNIPPLDVNDTVPNTFYAEDLLQSATEIATPSNANTPDLRGVDHAVQETRNLLEALSRWSAAAERNAAGGDTRPNSSGNPSDIPTQFLLTNSPAMPQDSIQNVLTSASPQLLHRLISYLGPLHNLLNSIPNVATSIRNINERIDNLDNTSFAHVPIEEIERKLEDMDARLLELENRMEEHNKVYAAIDVDHSSLDNVHTRRQAPNAAEMTSFTSNYSSRSIGSVQSMTSSALIVAAIDRREIEGIKERLDDLEAIFPTAADPWQIEVVLLPWGRELKGIWFTPDELMHGMSKATTQDSEEWTQARSLRSASRSSLPLPEAGSGWSSQAIHAWTNTTDEWLSPKACGTNNLVYKRLQSRGFIRKVTFKSSNARDIQAAIANAFGDLLEHLENACDNSNSHHSDAGDQAMDCFHGLRASFIPLRKVHKSSKLLFLTPDEMISAAHWTAHFLNSGVLMRAAGGQKRLFVTQREAYLQQSNHDDNAWTWQRMRELPRVHLSPDSQKEGNTDASTLHVAEADAKEACWSYYPACDSPASTTSSFSSSHSGQLSLRPAEPYHWPAEATPSTRPKPKQPISPLSEFPQKRPSRRSNRTVSVPLTDDDAFATAPSQLPQSSSKRRIGASFDTAADRKSVV